MKRKRNRLFEINKKYLIIAGSALAAVLLIVVLSLIISAGRISAEKRSAVSAVESVGLINVGLRGDLGPLCTYDTQTGTYSGLEKDVADEIIKRLFGDDIIVNFVKVNSETKDALLVSGGLDMSLAASVKGSTKGIDYSSVYYTDASALLVRQGEMDSYNALEGGTVAVVQGSTQAEKSAKDKKLTVLDDYLAASGISVTVKVYASYPEAVEALHDKFVNGVCAGEQFLKVFGSGGMLILPERFMPVGFCVEARASLGEFSGAVNDTLAAMKKDGTMDALLQKWDLADYSALYK